MYTNKLHFELPFFFLFYKLKLHFYTRTHTYTPNRRLQCTAHQFTSGDRNRFLLSYCTTLHQLFWNCQVIYCPDAHSNILHSRHVHRVSHGDPENVKKKTIVLYNFFFFLYNFWDVINTSLIYFYYKEMKTRIIFFQFFFFVLKIAIM